jgi:N-acetylglucosaminyl-diphospho-decaprenol L-rhamnosyltransferase
LHCAGNHTKVSFDLNLSHPCEKNVAFAIYRFLYCVLSDNSLMKLYVSVVSHGHGQLALQSLQQLCAGLDFWVRAGALHYSATLIHNTKEPATTNDEGSEQEQIYVQHDGSASFVKPILLVHQWNPEPLGFAANHNQSMQMTRALYADWLLIANPDLDWRDDRSFAALVRGLQDAPHNVGAISLTQVLPSGEAVEFARRLMTPWQLAKRAVNRLLGRSNEHVHIFQADWVNAACLVVRREVFETLGGFDERYRLYCEDIDFCLRLRMTGWKLAVLEASVVHDTRRDSARHWKFFLWHLTSLLKLWTDRVFWQFLWWRSNQGDSIVEFGRDTLHNIARNSHTSKQ